MPVTKILDIGTTLPSLKRGAARVREGSRMYLGRGEGFDSFRATSRLTSAGVRGWRR